MRYLKAFALGVLEFKCGFTAHFNHPFIVWYDWGREWAHRLTFRRFDDM